MKELKITAITGHLLSHWTGVWTGDETGGLWEYIRFQIPTYLGAGLSGQPNVGSDMDGIYGGQDPVVNTRDFQWKAFTPILIDMDGWGTSVKVPWEFGEPYASINRMYLKIKSQTLPYVYSMAWESHKNAIPMVRPMLIEYPYDKYNYGTETCYQYMWGSSFLVAPVYNKKENDSGLRSDIYLPDSEQVWIDYFSGERYQGGVVFHNFNIPLWKTPVFVKSGAIIPMSPANNSIMELDGSEDRIFDLYPDSESSFELYDDDGYSKEYKEKKGYSITKITSSCRENHFMVEVLPAKGQFHGMCRKRGTQFIINVSDKPSDIIFRMDGKIIGLSEASDFSSCLSGTNTYFYAESMNLNQYATKGSEFEKEVISSGPKLYVKIASYDITASICNLSMNLAPCNKIIVQENTLSIPEGVEMEDSLTTDSCAAITWEKTEDAEFYEIQKDGMIHTNITENCFEDPHVEAAVTYTYQVRSRTKDKMSPWSKKLLVTTKEDHYKNVPVHITAAYTGESHPYYLPESAVDHNNATFFSSYKGACGQDFILDMEMVYEIESLHYMPKELKEKGTITNMDVMGSIDGLIYKNIKENCIFTFEPEEMGYLTEKIVDFPKSEKVRFIKLHIREAKEDFAAAHALYPYKVPESSAHPAGDYNNDGIIDEGDLTFLQNYVGIRDTDNVWSHVSNADVNFNGLIDAYDMAFLTAQLEGGIQTKDEGVEGELVCSVQNKDVKAGDHVILTLEGKALKHVNAFSAEFIIDAEKFSLANCESGACKLSSALAEGSDAVSHMVNFSARREEKGVTRMFIAFANKGEKERLNGDCLLTTIHLKALQDMEIHLEFSHTLLVGSDFSVKE